MDNSSSQLNHSAAQSSTLVINPFNISSVYVYTYVCVSGQLCMLVMQCLYLTNLKVRLQGRRDAYFTEREKERGEERVSCFFLLFFFLYRDQMSSPGISTPLLCPLIQCTVHVCLWKCVLKICMDQVNTHSLPFAVKSGHVSAV